MYTVSIQNVIYYFNSHFSKLPFAPLSDVYVEATLKFVYLKYNIIILSSSKTVNISLLLISLFNNTVLSYSVLKSLLKKLYSK